MKQFLLLTSIIVLVAVVGRSQATICHVCSSLTDASCTEILYNKTKIECGKPDTTCLQRSVRYPVTDGHSKDDLLVRTCGLSGKESVGCSKSEVGGTQTETCHCMGDGCNSAAFNKIVNKASGTTAKARGTTKKPAGTTKKAIGTTKKPKGTTGKATATTNKSAGTTKKATATTKKPIGTTKKLTRTTKKPTGTTKKSTGTTKKATGTTKKSTGTTKKSTRTTKKSTGTTKKATGTTKKATGTTKKSTGTTRNPRPHRPTTPHNRSGVGLFHVSMATLVAALVVQSV